MKFIASLLPLLFTTTLFSQTWIDSLDNFAREEYRPAQNYGWTWQNATLLHAMEIQYEMAPPEEKAKYLNYVRQAMNRNILIANGLFPNGVASANGMAFVYRVTDEYIYLQTAKRVLNDYLNIIRVENGGVSHIAYAPELWDDTVYMIGVFLLAMYRATNDEFYLTELIDQIKAHQEKLRDDATGFWVHGWDGNNVYDIDFCSQSDWANDSTRRSSELWGRGNGWVIVTLSELLNNMEEDHPEWDFVANSLKDMIDDLPGLQDETTGHWYQLPYRMEEENNYLESSCTAMFGYGILTGLKYGIVSGEQYKNAIDKAYYGLRQYSTIVVGDNDQPYLNTTNVAGATCIGDKDYYLGIPTVNGKSYALAMFIIFGRTYYNTYINPPVITPTNNQTYVDQISIRTTVIGQNEALHIAVNLSKSENLTLTVVDIMGRTVFHTEAIIRSGSSDTTIPLNGLPAGHYFLTGYSEDGLPLKSKAFIIQ
ncbi:MAG: glycoside hydrolase family 88 protein [Chitinophagales bacterium]